MTTLGSGVDGSIRRVETNYDTQGNIYQITTYDAATSGSVVNQIQRGYNGLGQMIVEYQAVDGAVNTGSTPKVQWAYSEMASSANHSRLNTITYPNGRVLTHNYASGLDNNISRLSSISDGGTTLEGYDYLGFGTVVKRTQGSGIKLDYTTPIPATAGYNNADTATDLADGSVTWSNPSNALASDNSYARADFDRNAVTDSLEITDLDFALPSGSTIVGIEAQIERKKSGNTSIQDDVVQLTLNGSTIGSDKAQAVDWTNSDTTITYGGASDVWSTSLTSADINDTDFGLRIAVINNTVRSGSAYIDHVQLKVHYLSPIGEAGDQYTGLDRFGRVVDHAWTNSGGTAVDRFQYGHDRNSNRLYKENLVSAVNSELYAYDNLNQLTSFQRGTLNSGKTALSGAASRSQAWDFDALGNFDSQSTNGTAVSRSHNKQNEITSIAGATTPTYDANGSLTTDETGQTYKYDAWNRLIEVKNSGGTTIATNEYDGITRRVQETRSGTTRDMYYSDQWQVLEERIGGNTRDSYAWSPVYVDALIARDRDSDSNGSLDERLYAVQDANFNMTGLVNTSGVVVERFQLDSFGTPTFFDASWGSRGSSSYNFNYIHQGLRWDLVTATYSVRHRELRPTLGRWLQIDPIGFSGGQSNFYNFVGCSPLVGRDPIGLHDVVKRQCGPDITEWLENEMEVFYGEMNRLFNTISSEGTIADKLLFLKRTGNLWTDYKSRLKSPSDPNSEQFPFTSCYDTKKCANAVPYTVTLCGQCLGANQIGNIIYGFVATGTGLIDAARSYGQGSGTTASIGKIFGTFNENPWSKDGFDPREVAFNLGIELFYRRRKLDLPRSKAELTLPKITICSVLDNLEFRNPKAQSIFLPNHLYKPCLNEKYSGPNTDINNHVAPGIDKGGNRIK